MARVTIIVEQSRYCVYREKLLIGECRSLEQTMRLCDLANGAIAALAHFAKYYAREYKADSVGATAIDLLSRGLYPKISRRKGAGRDRAKV